MFIVVCKIHHAISLHNWWYHTQRFITQPTSTSIVFVMDDDSCVEQGRCSNNFDIGCPNCVLVHATRRQIFRHVLVARIVFEVCTVGFVAKDANHFITYLLVVSFCATNFLRNCTEETIAVTFHNVQLFWISI